MGEIADAIINGDIDEVTGEWIGNGQGYPRTLTKRGFKSDANTNFNHKTYGVQKATRQYLPKGKANEFILKYGLEQLGIKSNQIDEICAKIQENFGHYIVYLKKNH